MSYTPINWQTGDVITAEKLNKMDNGWGVQETQLFSETVTTTQMPIGSRAAGTLEYSGTEFPDTLNVTFDGTNYNCQRNYENESYEPTDGSNAFSLQTSPGGMWLLYTPSAGTYSISAAGNLVQVSSGFSAAVEAASTVDATMLPFLCVSGETTYDEMTQARESQRLLYFYYDYSVCCIVTNMYGTISGRDITFIPDDASFTAGFDEDDVFTLTPAS